MALDFRIPELPLSPYAPTAGQLLVIYDPSTDVTYRIPVQFLGMHTQGTDTGTSSNIFGIQYPSQNQDPDGNTVLVFGGAQGYAAAAIRYKWDQNPAVLNKLEFTKNYTGATSDVWQDLAQEGPPGDDGLDGAPGPQGISAYQGWLNLGNTGTEAQFYAWITSQVSKTIPLKLNFNFQEISILAEDWQDFDTVIQITGVSSTNQIASVSYEVKADGGTYVPKATYALVNDWIQANIVNGNKYWIKVIATPVAGGAGPAGHIITFNELG